MVMNVLVAYTLLSAYLCSMWCMMMSCTSEWNMVTALYTSPSYDHECPKLDHDSQPASSNGDRPKDDDHMLLNTLRSPLRTTAPTLLRRGLATTAPPLRFKQALPRLSPPTPMRLIARGAASSVSGRPGSQTLGHAAENIKEEVGNSTADLAKVIAGSNYTSDTVSPTSTTFVRIHDCSDACKLC
jgi:hypothetical protein